MFHYLLEKDDFSPSTRDTDFKPDMLKLSKERASECVFICPREILLTILKPGIKTVMIF